MADRYAKDPQSGRAGTGNPNPGSYKNLATGGTEKRNKEGCIEDEVFVHARTRGATQHSTAQLAADIA